MAIIARFIQKNIEKSLFQGKVIIIYGARQVGKTTLVKEIQKKFPDAVYFNCDEPDVRSALSNKTSTEIKAFLGEKKLVILDEAQRVTNIGMSLKLMADTYPEMQIIATGSSSFDLANKIIEPLTGRKREFYLYPLSLEEMAPRENGIVRDRLLERRMIYGMYPEIATGKGDALDVLKEMARSYLYKDILHFQMIKNSEAVEKLLQALALQIGNEVSYSELSSLVGVDKKTIASYVNILEQAFIVFRVAPFNRNLRNELKKLRKVYFHDTGVRNILINNVNPLHLRQDAGVLWENFMMSERLKMNQNHGYEKNMFFWRTRQGQEIDLVEEYGGHVAAFEFKLTSDKYRMPAVFQKAYPGSSITVVHRGNYKDFVLLS